MAVLEYLTANSLIAHPFKSRKAGLSNPYPIDDSWFYDIIFVSYSPTLRSVYISSISKYVGGLQIIFADSETSAPAASVFIAATDIINHHSNKNVCFASGGVSGSYAVKVVLGPGLPSAPNFSATYTKAETELANAAFILSTPRVTSVSFNAYSGEKDSNGDYTIYPVATIYPDSTAPSKLQLMHNISFKQEASNYVGLSVIAGAGAGLYNDCPEKDPSVYTINSVRPNASGSLFLNPSTCYAVEPLTLALKDSLTAAHQLDDYYSFAVHDSPTQITMRDVVEIDHSLVFKNYCKPKCSPETMNAFAHYLNRVTDGAADLDKIVTSSTETRGKGYSADTEGSYIFHVDEGDFGVDDALNPFSRCFGIITVNNGFLKNYHEGRTLQLHISETDIQSYTIARVIDTNTVQVAAGTPLPVIPAADKLFFKVNDNGVISNLNCAALSYNSNYVARTKPYFEVKYATSDSYSATGVPLSLLAVAVILYNPSTTLPNLKVVFTPSSKLSLLGYVKVRNGGITTSLVAPAYIETKLACHGHAYVEAIYSIGCGVTGGTLSIAVSDITDAASPVLLGGPYNIFNITGAECTPATPDVLHTYLIKQTTDEYGSLFEGVELLPIENTAGPSLVGNAPDWLLYNNNYVVVDPPDRKAVRLTTSAVPLAAAINSALYTLSYKVTDSLGAYVYYQIFIDFVAKPVIAAPSVYTANTPLSIKLTDIYTSTASLFTIAANNMVALSSLTKQTDYTYNVTVGDTSPVPLYEALGLNVDTTNGKVYGTLNPTLPKGSTYQLNIFATNPAGTDVATVFLHIVSDIAPELALANPEQTTYEIDNATIYANIVPLVATNPPIFKYTLIEGVLPTGLRFNEATGAISGKLTEQQAGEKTISVIAANGYGASNSVTFTISYPTILTPPTFITPVAPAQFTASIYSDYPEASPLFTATATGGGTLTYSSSVLPPGFTLDTASGKFYGKLLSSAYPANYNSVASVVKYTIQLSVSNTIGYAVIDVLVTFSTIDTPIITNLPSKLTVIKDRVYDTVNPLYKLTATNGPIFFLDTASGLPTHTLPPGLTITTSGSIIGTVLSSTAVAGDYTTTITGYNYRPTTTYGSPGAGPPATCVFEVLYTFTKPANSSVYSLTVNTPISPIAVGVCGVIGEIRPVNSITASALPIGLTLNNATASSAVGTGLTQTITGTPSVIGSTTCLLTSTSASKGTTTRYIILNVVTKTYSVSGTIKDSGTSAAIAGVTVSLDNKSVNTDIAGKYTITGLITGTAYKISAAKTGYFFAGSPKTFSVSVADVVVDFTGTTGFRQVTGRITTAAPAAVPNISVTDGISTANTDGSGNYSLTISSAATTITPLSTTYVFSPSYKLLAGSSLNTTADFTATYVGLLPAVSNLALTTGNTTLKLSFNVLTSNIPYISKFEYNYNNNGWVAFTPTAGTPVGQYTPYSYTITGLTNGTFYNVSVRAVSTANASGAVTSTAGIPISIASAPVLAVRPSDASLNLSITGVSLGGGSFLRYDYSTDNKVNWLPVPAPSYSISSQTSAGNPQLANGTTYTVYVRAVTLSGGTQLAGTASGGVSATPQKPAAAPTIVTITPASAQLGLTNITLPTGTLASAVNRYEYDVDNHEQWSAVLLGPGAVDTNWAKIIFNETYGGQTLLYSGRPTVTGSINGTTLATYNLPTAITKDNTNNFYIADTANHVIRKISSTGVVTTFAGTVGVSGTTDGVGAAARFNSPQGICTDGVTMLFVADTGNHTIRRITLSGTLAGTVVTLSGKAGVAGMTNGANTVALYNSPTGMHYYGGIIYLADTGNNQIRKVGTTGFAALLSGSSTGAAGSAESTTVNTDVSFSSPRGVHMVPPFLYVADTGNNKIRKLLYTVGRSFNANGYAGSPTNAAGSADTTLSPPILPATTPDPLTATFNQPMAVAGDASAIYVADYGNNTIRKIYISGTLVGTVTTLCGVAGAPGSDDGSGSSALFNGPTSMVLGSGTLANNLFVLEKWNNTVRKISTTGPILVNGKSYSVRVRLVTAVGPGAPSNSYRSIPGTVPSAPQNVSLAVADKSIIVSYTDPANNGGYPIGAYFYMISTVAGSFLAGVVTLPNNSVITGLTNGTTYYVRIAAQNAIGIGAWADAPAGAIPAPRPTLPSYTLTPGNTQFTFSNIKQTTGSPAVTQYQYSVDSSGIWSILPANNIITQTYLYDAVSGKTSGAATFINGTSYDISLRGTNTAGPGPGETSVGVAPGAQAGAVVSPVAYTGATFTGAIAGNILTVTNVTSGVIVVGEALTGTNVATGTTIVNQLSIAAGYAAGNRGTYTVSVTKTVAATTITATLAKSIIVTFSPPTYTGGFSVVNYEYSAVTPSTAADAWVARSDFGVGVLNASSPIVINKTSAGAALVTNTSYTVKIRAVTGFSAAPKGATSSTMTVVAK